MKQYQITVRYITPAGRKSEYTDEVFATTYEDAKHMTLNLMVLDPRRKVESVTGFTGTVCE